MTNANPYPRTATTKVSGPFEAECPEDGGKWAIYCEHFDANGEVTYCSILQDTNKSRARSWKKDSLEWCGLCQEEARGGSNWSFHNPYADKADDPTREETTVTTIQPKRELTIAELRINYFAECASKKPYVVTVESMTNSGRKRRYLQSLRSKKVVTTTTIGNARGFDTAAEAVFWIQENERRFGLLTFAVENRREIANAALDRLTA